MRFHTVDELFRAMKRIVKTYPHGTGLDGHEFGVRPFAKQLPMLSGTAFFPGGYGTWRDDPAAPAPTLPVGGTVFIGHNFDGTDSKSNRNPDLDRIDELDSDTWLGMIEILGSLDLKIPTERCFFTNALIGERIGTAVGKIRLGSSGKIYKRQCDAFLRLQIRWLKPSIIVVLGAEIIGRFKSISPDIRKAWRGCSSLVKIEERN